jgi:hypothetical protein
VSRVDSFVDLDPSLTLGQYQMLAATLAPARPPAIQEAVARMMGRQMALLVVHTPYAAGSDAARDLVRRIRESHPPGQGRLLVTGHTAFDVDFTQLVRDNAPRAVALIVAATYVVLFLLLGSILLPAKAVVMNFLSISASYGALVWIFQDGHLARWLNFTPGPIETGTPLIMFCVVFGLSMDYGVLLLSRMLEEYQRTGDNVLAVGVGLERTGRLITAAAAIMAAVFFAFALADLVVIKAIGIGMGIAVVLDAPSFRTPRAGNDAAPGPLELVSARPLVRWHARRRAARRTLSGLAPSDCPRLDPELKPFARCAVSRPEPCCRQLAGCRALALTTLFSAESRGADGCTTLRLAAALSVQAAGTPISVDRDQEGTEMKTKIHI